MKFAEILGLKKHTFWANLSFMKLNIKHAFFILAVCVIAVWFWSDRYKTQIVDQRYFVRYDKWTGSVSLKKIGESKWRTDWMDKKTLDWSKFKPNHSETIDS